MFAMRRGGLVAYGGFLGGLAGSYFFLRRHRIPLLPWADVAVPSLASGLMITRIGCYLFGCDFGQPLKESAPAFLKKLGTFPRWDDGTLEHGSGAPAWVQHVKERGLSPTSTASLPVHPTQIYESLVGLLLLALLLWARKKQKFRGEIFFLFAFSYGVCRYLLEILRDDAERGSIPPSLPEHILLPLGLAVLAVGWVVGFSQAIGSTPLRRATQVVAFVPVVALYFALKPETFAAATSAQLSTSQFIAITSGFAASVAFAVLYKAALAHPKQAMDLGLPPALAPAGPQTPGAAPPDVDHADDDEEEARILRPKKTAKSKVKAKTKAAKKPPPEPNEASAASEEEPKAAGDEPKKKEEEPKGGSSSEEDDEPGAGEPVKAS
jgi:phosphatidylglycerol:prolipoprotein diacylglycerol transferase